MSGPRSIGCTAARDADQGDRLRRSQPRPDRAMCRRAHLVLAVLPERHNLASVVTLAAAVRTIVVALRAALEDVRSQAMQARQSRSHAARIASVSSAS